MTVSTFPQALGTRYVLLEPIGTGGMGAVYRATDRLTADTVALKRVMLPPDQLAFASRSETLRSEATGSTLALAQEFRLLASLHHPSIIQVLDFGFDEQRQPFYTMDLLTNSQTIVEAGQAQDVATKVGLLVQALQALVYLHRRNILHRDLKPGNVRVVDGQVKVLDFGLSVTTSRTMEYHTQTTKGTMAYLAPELFTGAPVTVASDLYAVGMMAYELFAGRYPYDNTNLAVLMYDIVSTPVDVRSIGVGVELAAVLERLLVKSGAERYGDASQVICDLCAATGCSPPPETVEVRESFLQAARFVGRDEELGCLSRALEAALAGRGSAWLVGGESGVGKSRLVDELRILALVEGATVLRGQAVSQGGSPYHLWRDVLRWLALTVDLAPEEASVLKPLVPDIASLVGFDVSDAPPLDPQAAQSRLLWVVGQVFGRQEQPVVVLLEDLQWAGSESLAMLNRLTRRTGPECLLFVGTYRDEERPHLPEALPGMQVLKLERLTEKGVAELSASMLGPSGRRQPVVDLLQRETEGNPFFLVEVVRALAEEAGQLDQIAVMTLPLQVFASGVQELVQHRLNRVSQGARPLLRLAAVAGRELDLDVLRAIRPDMDLDRWLAICADAAVLEVNAGRWRFAHDKLREGALDALSEDARPMLHRQMAEAIESVYPDAPEQVATLAHLWGIAGEMDKELHYYQLAGEKAASEFANQEAIQFLTRTLELEAQRGADVDRFRQVRWTRLLGEAERGLGNLSKSRRYFCQALDFLGQPMPATSRGLIIGILGQVVHQVWRRVWPTRTSSASPEARASLLEAARIYGRLVLLYGGANESVPSLYVAFRGFGVAARAGPSPQLARAYAAMHAACRLLRLHRLAQLYRRQAREAAQELNDLHAHALVLLLTGLWSIGFDPWTSVHDTLRQAVALYEQLGDRRGQGDALTFVGYVLHYQAQFARAMNVFADLYALADSSDNPEHRAWGLNCQAMSMLPLGQTEQAVTLLETAWPLLAAVAQSRTSEILNRGLVAMARLRQGRMQAAQQAAETAASLMGSSLPVLFALFDGYAGVAQVYLALWEETLSGRIQAEARTQRAAARRACQALLKYACYHPVGQSRAWLCQGQFEWLSGHLNRAQRHWRQSLASARRLAMPYEEALAHYEIGRHLRSDDPARQEHLAQAADILARVGAVYDLERVREAERDKDR